MITEPEHITEWFTDAAELDLRLGGGGRFVWNAKATNREHIANLRIERLEPPRFFSTPPNSGVPSPADGASC